MARRNRKPGSPAQETLDLNAALESLRADLRRWPGVDAACRVAVPLIREYQDRLRRQGFDDQVDPDPRNVRERADWLDTYAGPVRRRLRTVEEWDALVERIKTHAPAVAAAAERAGIDAAPLLLFAADLDERQWEAA